jgi:hypothetical protein
LFSESLSWKIATWTICLWNKFEEKAQCVAEKGSCKLGFFFHVVELLMVQIIRLHVVFEFPWVTRPYLHDLTIYILFFCRFWEPSWTERKFVSLVFLAQPPNTLKFCLYSGKYINILCWLSWYIHTRYIILFWHLI